IADYPFTTLVPSLGVVDVHGGPRVGGSTFVVADIPGLVPGASEGVGLGIEFLKHVERCRVLLHLVTLDPGEERDPVRDWEVLRRELQAFSPELAERPEIVAVSQTDRPEVLEALPSLAAAFAARGIKLRSVSAVTRDGLAELVEILWHAVRGEPIEIVEPPAAPDADEARAARRASARSEAAPGRKATARKGSARKAPAKTKKAPAKTKKAPAKTKKAPAKTKKA